MWWLYCNYTSEPSIELETEKENMKLLLGFSILSTIVTVRHFVKESHFVGSMLGEMLLEMWKATARFLFLFVAVSLVAEAATTPSYSGSSLGCIRGYGLCEQQHLHQ